jgi:hypothetical protein
MHALSDGTSLLNSKYCVDPILRGADTQLIAMQEVALRNDPYQAIIVIENGKAPLVRLE